jgi:hypothetical protein
MSEILNCDMWNSFFFICSYRIEKLVKKLWQKRLGPQLQCIQWSLWEKISRKNSNVFKLNFGPYCRYCIPLVYWLASNIYNTHSNMSLGETRKLLQQSRKIVDEADDNTNISVLLNTILKLVSSIDVRLQGVEKSVGKFDEIKILPH